MVIECHVTVCYVIYVYTMIDLRHFKIKFSQLYRKKSKIGLITVYVGNGTAYNKTLALVHSQHLYRIHMTKPGEDV